MLVFLSGTFNDVGGDHAFSVAALGREENGAIRSKRYPHFLKIFGLMGAEREHWAYALGTVIGSARDSLTASMILPRYASFCFGRLSIGVIPILVTMYPVSH